MILIAIIVGILTGLFWYGILINDRGKYGKGDTVDKVQSVIIGICGFLLSGVCLFT